MFSCKFHHLPNTNGAPMYAPRMSMDPRFGYPTHIPRHGNPSLSHVPHNFNMQVYKRGCNINLKLLQSLIQNFTGGQHDLCLFLCYSFSVFASPNTE